MRHRAHHRLRPPSAGGVHINAVSLLSFSHDVIFQDSFANCPFLFPSSPPLGSSSATSGGGGGGGFMHTITIRGAVFVINASRVFATQVLAAAARVLPEPPPTPPPPPPPLSAARRITWRPGAASRADPPHRTSLTPHTLPAAAFHGHRARRALCRGVLRPGAGVATSRRPNRSSVCSDKHCRRLLCLEYVRYVFLSLLFISFAV